ncbi:MAG TPA: PQQ-binding-like beta-propeller repeat protein [Pyrinomonadaceae bacterium]|nr:PQQ-binding-like beta-propeller repeat protein [Pyrinomonadaceae bacterium]
MYFRLSTLLAIGTLLILCLIVTNRAQQNGRPSPALVKCVARTLVATTPQVVATDGPRILIGSSDGALTSYDQWELETVWRTELGGEFVSEPVSSSGNTVVVMNSAGNGGLEEKTTTIRLLGGESGIVQWSTRLPYADQYWLAVINGLVIALSSDGSLVKLDMRSGKMLGQVNGLGKISVAPAISENSAAISSASKEVILVSLSSFEAEQRATFDHQPTFLSFAGKEGLLVGDERGHLFRLGDPISRTLWRFKSGGAVSFASYSDEGIFMTSFDNFVYLLSDYNGSVVWKRRLTGRVFEGATFIDDALVALVPGEGSVFVLQQKNGKLLDSIPSSDRGLISLAPIDLGNGKFALAFTQSLEIYGLGSCEQKFEKATP